MLSLKLLQFEFSVIEHELKLTLLMLENLHLILVLFDS